MTPARRALLSAYFLAIIGGQTYDVITQHEDWPFSSYPMYSDLRKPVVKRTEFVGVGPEGEFPLTPEVHFSPLDNTRFQRVLALIRRGKDASTRQATAADSLVRAYERGRNAGSHHGPPLVALRSYDMSWQIRSGAVNRDTPDTRSLAFYLYLPSVEVGERVRRAAAGQLGPQDLAARRPVAARDLVAAASTLTVGADVARVDDPDATDGFAWVFARPASNDIAARSARVSLAAERRAYTLWIRGKTRDGSGALDGRVVSGGTFRCEQSTGLGNWGEAFPPGAFAWSSGSPGAPPCIVDATGGNLVVEVSARAGTVMLDELWLATAQPEAPAFAEAVAVSPTGLVKR